jgi:cyclophilin family peptidyl-prolyl cis-trans isomerase
MIKSPWSSLVLALAVSLAGCGGGGGDAGGPPPTVSSVTTGNATYSQTLLITAQGNNLDQGVGASSAGCRNMVLSTTAPNVSNASTAYFRCTVSGVGAQTVSVTRSSDGGVLGTTAFNVAVPQVTMAVSNGAGVAGNLVVTLEAAKAPVTVDNFLAYVNAGFYDGTIVHRNSPGFVLQGGGYASPVAVGPTFPNEKTTSAPIVLEDNAGLSNLRYTIAMARTGVPDSATSQFFINLADNTQLNRTVANRGYAVFGTVTANTALVDAMAAAPCTGWLAFFGNNSDCLPTPNLVITSAMQTR